MCRSYQGIFDLAANFIRTTDSGYCFIDVKFRSQERVLHCYKGEVLHLIVVRFWFSLDIDQGVLNANYSNQIATNGQIKKDVLSHSEEIRKLL